MVTSGKLLTTMGGKKTRKTAALAGLFDLSACRTILSALRAAPCEVNAWRFHMRSITRLGLVFLLGICGGITTTRGQPFYSVASYNVDGFAGNNPSQEFT